LEDSLKLLPAKYRGLEIRVVDLKDPERVRAKAEKEYSGTIRQPGPGISWVCDVVRASVVCTSLQQIVNVVEWLQDNAYYIVSAKNPLPQHHSPTSHGFEFLSTVI
jgi:hypothetical protein